MTDTALEELLAKQAITEVLYRYCRGLDRLDRELLLSLAHADGTVEFSQLFKGAWPDFVEWLLRAHHDMLFNNHRVTNILIELDGDRAASETSSTATLLVEPEPGRIVERWVHSRYLDRWSRRGGRWAIEHRRAIRDFRRETPVSPADFKNRYQFEDAGRHGSDDPSYALFRR